MAIRFIKSKKMYYNSPIGTLKISAENGFISEINFMNEEKENSANNNEDLSKQNPLLLNKCCKQLNEYFSGKRFRFDFPISQNGTQFQEKVWNELLNIPYGKTLSYLRLSQLIENPKSIRAVGTANGRNNIAIVVPCHRVIGSNGKLTGYAGGLWRKQWLLEHENKFANGAHLLF